MKNFAGIFEVPRKHYGVELNFCYNLIKDMTPVRSSPNGLVNKT